MTTTTVPPTQVRAAAKSCPLESGDRLTRAEFERHIDIQADDKPFSPYCSTPEQIARRFQACKRAKEMCGQPGTEKALPLEKEWFSGSCRGERVIVTCCG